MTRLILSVLALLGFLGFVTAATWEDRGRTLLTVGMLALVTIYRAREAKTREQTQVVETAPSEEAGRERRRIAGFVAVVTLLLLLWQFLGDR
jgi:hypothetical protein